MKVKSPLPVVERRAGVRSRRLPGLLICSAIALATAGYATAAEAAWFVNGVFVSNICRAPSGAYWVYPVEYAQPVGSGCRILATGEYGTVTAY